jgi:V8-like Glu-specific endopeptidase
MFPWVVHGMVEAVFPGYGIYRGTGTMIGPDCFITAAHCLYMEKRYASEITFRIGIHHQVPLIEATSDIFYVHPRYLEDENHGYDIGMVKIDKPLGQLFGYASLTTYSIHDLYGMSVNVTGYPGSRKFTELLLRKPSYDLYTMEGSIVSVNDHKFFYNLDTSGGQSAAGVWREAEDEVVECIEVHTTGSKVEGNGAVRFSQENSPILLQWLSKLSDA